MKHVSEFKPYADAIAARDEIQSALDSARTRHAELAAKLANRDQGALPQHDPMRVAMQIARGERPDARVEIDERWRAEEMALRTAIDRLERGLAAAVERVGLEQRRAHNAAFRTRTVAIAKLRADWARHCRGLLAAMDAEDAMLAELVDGGFGKGDAIVTMPPEHRVERERLRDAVAFELVRVGELSL